MDNFIIDNVGLIIGMWTGVCLFILACILVWIYAKYKSYKPKKPQNLFQKKKQREEEIIQRELTDFWE